MTDEFIYPDLDEITEFFDGDYLALDHDIPGSLETNRISVANTIQEILYRTRYQINRTVPSGNLLVALKNAAGADASVNRPLTFIINGTLRKLTSSLSIQLNSGTNYFNLGATELFNLQQELFVYIGYRASTSTMFLVLSRMPGVKEYADFGITSTGERYGAFTGATPAGTDKVEVIGRINIQNAGSGSSYAWSIPAADIIINRPIYETSWLSWTPQISAVAPLTWTTAVITFARYKLSGGPSGLKTDWVARVSGTLGGSAGATVYFTVPFEAALAASSPNVGAGTTAGVAARVFITAGTPDQIYFQQYNSANYATSGSNVVNGLGFYEA
jgi:hypothetical protein